MKKILLIIALISISFFSFSQKSFNQISRNQTLKTKVDTLQFQISFTNYCLEKYRKEKVLGTWLQIGGAVGVSFFNISQLNGMRAAEDNYSHELALAGSNLAQQIAARNKFETKNNEIIKRQDFMTILGGVAFLAGSILQLDSYKWLKRDYITPSENGIGVRIRF